MSSNNDRFKLTAEQKKIEGNKALAEYRAREEAINKNTERLRALRLAHEAQNPPAPKSAGKAKSAGNAKKTSLSQYLKRETDAGRGT